MRARDGRTCLALIDAPGAGKTTPLRHLFLQERRLRTPVPGVRRVLMKRTKHHVYYVNDTTNGVVYVIAVWGAPKEGDPVLHNPLR